MAYFLSPIGNSPQITATGAPLNAGTITTFQAGTATPVATYTDNAGSNGAVSLTLNTLGLPSSPVWLLGGQAVKFVVKDSLGNLIRTIDNVSGINDPAAVPLGAGAVRALVGNVNAATPLTKYDLQAGAVTVRNAAGALVTLINTATITCDLGLAGPAANGRDQSAAFAINSWVYLYFIWNGATLAAIASPIAPASFTGSTLPTGYTQWAFATVARWNASSNIIPAFTQGANVFYDIADAGVNRVMSGGLATVMTVIGAGTLIPPVALFGKFNFTLSATNASIASFTLYARRTGSSITGIAVTQVNVPVAGGSGLASNALDFPVNASGQFDYKLSGAPSGGGGAFIDVLGYVLPNGDA